MKQSSTSSLAARVFTLMLFLACFAPFLKCQENKPAADGKTHPEFVVSTQWLAAHLSDPKVVILHVGNAGDYKDAHIPGARFVAGDKISAQGPPGVELLPDDQLKANLEALGVSDDSRVVIYTPDWQPMAARVFFTLDYLGFHNAALLDGGMDAWLAEKRATSNETPTVARGTLTIRPHPEIVAKLDAVKELAGGANSHTVLVDARPLRRYRSGHLAGALPIFWEKNLKGPEEIVQLLKSPEELRKMYVAAGVTPGKKIVSYCEVGLQASYAFFIARYLGYDAAMFDGSWSEWSSAKQPSVRGDSAK